MKFMSSAIASLLIAFCGCACASDATQKEVKTFVLKSEFETKSDWHVTAWQSTAKDFAMGDVPAKLCFWVSQENQENACTPITSTASDGGFVYPYQTVRELEVVHPDTVHPRAALLKFDAQYSGGASGWLDQVSLWKYDKQADRFELWSHITLTEQGEYRLFNKGNLNGMLVTADAILQTGETHFAPHRFYVEVYRYTPDSGYTKILGYLTPSKYRSLDDAEKIDVIAHEVSRIERLAKKMGGQ